MFVNIFLCLTYWLVSYRPLFIICRNNSTYHRGRHSSTIAAFFRSGVLRMFLLRNDLRPQTTAYPNRIVRCTSFVPASHHQMHAQATPQGGVVYSGNCGYDGWSEWTTLSELDHSRAASFPVWVTTVPCVNAAETIPLPLGFDTRLDASAELIVGGNVKLVAPTLLLN